MHWVGTETAVWIYGEEKHFVLGFFFGLVLSYFDAGLFKPDFGAVSQQSLYL